MFFRIACPPKPECLVTTQAMEAAPMAHRTGRLVQVQFAGGVRVEEIRGVAGGRQLRLLRVAELTTIWRIELVVADQAVRHLRQRAALRPVGCFQAAMAALAGVVRVQLRAQVRGRRRQIRLLIDSRGDQRRHISQLQMQLMIEAREAGCRRGGDRRRLMTL